MRIIKIFIIPVLAGLFGGIIGAVAAVVFINREMTLTAGPAFQPSFVGILKARSLRDSFDIARAAGSVVAFYERLGKERIAEEDSFSGMGMVVSADGIIATTASLPRSNRELSAVSADRRVWDVETALQVPSKPRKSEREISFVKIKPEQLSDFNLRPAAFTAFERIAIGQYAFSFHPRGELLTYRIVSAGITHENGKPISSEDMPALIVLDPAPSPGVPIFTPSGELLGMAEQSGKVIPAEFIGNVVRARLQGTEFNRTAFGIHFIDLTRVVAFDPLLPQFGLLVSGRRGLPAVKAGSPAALAGIKEGDVLVSFDGRRLDGTVPFPLLLQRYKPETGVEAVILRGGNEEKINIVLGSEL